MPDVSDLSKKNLKPMKIKASGNGSKSKPNDMDFSLNAAVEAALLQRPSRPTPTSRPLPVITDAMSESRIKNRSSGHKNTRKSLEDSSSAASSPGMKKHTPATIPRTKFTSATPLEQRIAISKLKQRLEFADKDEDSSIKQEIGGKNSLNNEGAAAASAVLYDQASISSIAESLGASQLESDASDMVDMSRIIQRLNQVRDYLKQATSLYVNLSTKDQLEKSEEDHVDKLGKLIQQLRIQEQGYVDLLQRTLDMDYSANMTPASSVLSLKQSEADDVEDSQEELNKLQMQHSLLQKIVEQQQQIQDLKKKQASLAALQEQAEETMRAAEIDVTDSAAWPNNLRGESFQNMLASLLQESNSLPKGKRAVSQETQPPSEQTMDNEEAALLDADMVQKKLELENKLMNLQAKKEKMDVLLRTLKSSRDALSSNVGKLAHQSQQTEQAAADNAFKMDDASLELPRSSQGNADQEALHQVQDVQGKLKKLKEVKQRLEDLGQIVSEYEQSQSNQLLMTTGTDGDGETNVRIQENSQGSIDAPSNSYGGARPRNRQTAADDFSDGLDNRMRPKPPGGRFLKPAIDVTRNRSSVKEAPTPQNIDAILASEKNLAADFQDEDLTSKIRQLQEARQRLASIQRSFQSAPQQQESTAASNSQAEDNADLTTASECESESESVTTTEDLSWQEDPEFQAKVRRLQLAKEKLKHLQDLVNSAQLDGISMDELANISISSKASSEYDKEEKDEDEGEEESSDEEDEVTTDQESQANNDNDNDDASIEPTATAEDKDEESDGSNLNQAVTMLDREMGYQLRLSQQKKELEKLLKEKQKLLEAQRQLSEIARSTFVSKEEEENESANEKKSSKKQEKSPREVQNLQKEAVMRSQAKQESTASKTRDASKTEKTGHRVTYKDLQVPRIVKRTSNISVEPQFGSDSDFRTKRTRTVAQANKHQQAGGRPSNPLVMSELRRQREMFEQNKKLKFVEKQRRKRDSGDDRSDGGTYSIRSDIDEGVGVSMFSADVTTAATWGGSTEQSSTEEDSAVEEDDYPEGEVEIEDDYEENIGQPEEEEEEIADEESEEDDVPPLFDFKKKPKKQKRDKPEPWFNVGDRRDQQRGKKRKLESGRANTSRGSTVSWSMNVSPEASRSRRRQQNLTPAHKLMRNRPSRPREEYNSNAIEDQCEQLKQQLTNSNAFTATLLRNQQTLLTMLQNQTTSLDQPRALGYPPSREVPQSVFAEARGFQSPFAQAQETQRSQQILQALNRCTSQLDRQCQDIQHLQREFQNMAVNPLSGQQRVYPWENPSPLNIDTGYNAARINELFRPSASAKNDPFNNTGSYQQQFTNSSGLQYRPGLIHSATSPHACLDDTENRYTQTELPSNAANSNARSSYSLFGQQHAQAANQSDSKPSDFSPFRFYDLDDTVKEENEFFPSTSAAYRIESDGVGLNQDNNDTYDPLVYTDTSAGPVLTGSKGAGVSSDVITTSYPTPSKSAATRNLAERQKATWPSFLKDAEQLDSVSERTLSQYESIVAGRGANAEFVNERRRQEKEAARDDNMERMSVASNFSLFETMRDSIYSEVATLISMNESRPHYLVELFRELQLLTSDYLRQRALYSLQDLVTRFLTEDSEMRQSNEPTEEVYQNWIGTAAAEQTPTESGVTTDDEYQENKALEALSSQIRNNDMYDYAEMAETASTMSTPTSNQDPPFAAEGLGDTVINLDEALQNMRMYEEKMAEARRNASDENRQDAPTLLTLSAAAAASENSSAYDVNSEASSDIQQPSIDTQKLDRQIKAIMLELIPFLNEHMESQCTPSFLSELRNLILKLAKEKEPEAEKQEFGRSFHRQLESVLKDSLSKFESRSLKECGEDILIDISEILFNELAFFRLMQDLDRPMSRQPGLYWRKDSDTDGQLAAVEIESEDVTESTGQSSASAAPAYENGNTSQSVGYLVNTTGTLFSPPAPRHNESTPKRTMFEVPLTIEDIEVNGSDAEDETEASRQFVNVELSVSESRPVTSTGSGEEDVEEDQQNFPVQNRAPESSVGAQQQADVAVSSGTDESDDIDVDDIDEMPEDEEQRISPRSQALQQDRTSSAEPVEDEREEDGRDEVTRQEEEHVEVDAAAGAARPDADIRNEDGEDNEITIDDLPTKLTGLTEADLQTRMESEQNAVEGAVGVLAHLEDNEAEELAEDSSSVAQPDQPASNSSHE